MNLEVDFEANYSLDHSVQNKISASGSIYFTMTLKGGHASILKPQLELDYKYFFTSINVHSGEFKIGFKASTSGPAQTATLKPSLKHSIKKTNLFKVDH